MVELSCPTCGYPVGIKRLGQILSCASCGNKMEAYASDQPGPQGPYNSMVRISQEVGIPAPLFAWVIGLVIGVIAGPAIVASTKSGAQALERLARQRLDSLAQEKARESV